MYPSSFKSVVKDYDFSERVNIVRTEEYGDEVLKHDQMGAAKLFVELFA